MPRCGKIPKGHITPSTQSKSSEQTRRECKYLREDLFWAAALQVVLRFYGSVKTFSALIMQFFSFLCQFNLERKMQKNKDNVKKTHLTCNFRVLQYECLITPVSLLLRRVNL